MLTPAIVILGATASGKTALALALAQHYPIEIISIDSALVYRGMDIGTAKPSLDELAQCPHHLINILSPLAAYSAADFIRDVPPLLQAIRARGRLPVLVGGTMLYYKALRDGLDVLPPAQPEVRAALEAELAAEGIAALYARLQRVDPPTATRLATQDTQRILRALEVWEISGKPLSALCGQARPPVLPGALRVFALMPSERSLLHARIAVRFQAMLAAGFVEEVRQLQIDYPSLSLAHPAMRCVGYRQAWQYLAGEITEVAFAEAGIAATRQLAKRQLTWLRSFPEVIPLDALKPSHSLCTTLIQTFS